MASVDSRYFDVAGTVGGGAIELDLSTLARDGRILGALSGNIALATGQTNTIDIRLYNLNICFQTTY